MVAVGDHVTIKGTTHPVGIVEELVGSTIAIVKWGVADDHLYLENIPQSKLQLFTDKIVSADEVEHRNVFDKKQ